MKLLIASDIHGDAECTEAMLRQFDRLNCDGLLLLGDILYHGPRNDLPSGYNPKRVIKMLNERKDLISAVRGNCDAEVDQMVLEFSITAQIMRIADGDIKMTATHGHKFNIDSLPPLANGEHLLHGHTHVITRLDMPNGGKLLNPGSISIPKNGNPKSFMLYTDGAMISYDLDGNKLFDVKL